MPSAPAPSPRLGRLLAPALSLLMAGAVCAAEVPPAHQALLLLRAIAYDRRLKERAGDRLVIAVAHGGPRAEGDCGDLVGALRERARQTTVAGLMVQVVTIPYSATSFESQLGGSHAPVLFVCDELSGQAGAISAVTRRKSVLSAAGLEAPVRAGLSIGLYLRDGKPAIIVNLPAAQAEGASIDPALLRVAQVLR